MSRGSYLVVINISTISKWTTEIFFGYVVPITPVWKRYYLKRCTIGFTILSSSSSNSSILGNFPIKFCNWISEDSVVIPRKMHTKFDRIFTLTKTKGSDDQEFTKVGVPIFL